VGSGTFIEDFKQELEFTPIEGQPNVYSIRRRDDHTKRNGAEMTAGEWDKFEKDVADAFERVP
jgi:hypothetical protein